MSEKKGLVLIPMTLREANAFVEQNHRHHKPVVGHKFSIGVSDGEKVVGVAIVGRPVGRFLDDGWTLEVTRLCTDGTRNACSMLYAAAWRAARDVKARRAGVQLGMLFIDEPPFLDADGTEAYADALVNMAARNPNMRILAISHDPTMKARFSQNIIVTGGEDGSSVTME